MKKLLLPLCCAAALSACAAAPKQGQAAQTQQSAAQQSGLHRLHSAVMSAIDFEQTDEAALKRHFEYKMSRLPRKQSAAIRRELDKYRGPDDTGSGMFALYWYLADALQQKLSALPPPADAESERLRRKWLADAARIERQLAQCGRQECSGSGMGELFEEINAVFGKNGLKTVN